MKRLMYTILCFFVFNAINTNAQNLIFESSFNQTEQYCDTNSSLSFFGSVTNLACCSSVDISMSITSDSLPVNWNIGMDTPDGSDTANATFSLLPSQTGGISISFDIGNRSGNGTAIIRIADASKWSNVYDEYTFTVKNDTVTVAYMESTEEETTSIIDNSNHNHIYLSQNQPNPFKDHTTINYQIKTTQGKIVLSNLLGKIIKEYIIIKNDKLIINESLPPGIYFYSLFDGGNIIQTKKLNIIQ